jgi:hypothetical protein
VPKSGVEEAVGAPSLTDQRQNHHEHTTVLSAV